MINIRIINIVEVNNLQVYILLFLDATSLIILRIVIIITNDSFLWGFNPIWVLTSITIAFHFVLS